MKAVTYRRYGPPDVLELTEVPQPTPKSHELLVRVHASSVKIGDLWARNFSSLTSAQFSMPLPLWFLSRLAFGVWKPRIKILGAEFAGEVAQVGNQVTRFRVGDPVFGYRGPTFGCNAEYLCISERGLVAPKPQNLSFAEAATVPYGALTALNLLRKVNLEAGQKILINGASGGIGSAAVQLARHAGAEVTGVCGAPRKSYVQSLGAAHVIDYAQENFTQNGQTYHVIFDILRKTSFAEVQNALTPHGTYLLASFKTPQLLQMIRTRHQNQKVVCALSQEKPADLLEISQMLQAGHLKAQVHQQFPLEKTAEAHRYLESGQATGPVAILCKP